MPPLAHFFVLVRKKECTDDGLLGTVCHMLSCHTLEQAIEITAVCLHGNIQTYQDGASLLNRKTATKKQKKHLSSIKEHKNKWNSIPA